MKARPMNRRFTLEARQSVPDGAGGFSITWVPLGLIYGSLTPGAGKEVGEVEVKLAQVPYRITVRAAPVSSPRRPKPEQRFREGTRAFSILAVADSDSAGTKLTCFVVEELPQ